MNEQQEQHLFETLGRLDERTETMASDFKEFKEASLFRLATVERKQAGAETAFEKQRASCKQRLSDAEKLRRPWYIAGVSFVVGLIGGMLSRLVGGPG